LIEALPVSTVMYLPVICWTYTGNILRAIEAACRKGINVMRLTIRKAIVPNEEFVRAVWYFALVVGAFTSYCHNDRIADIGE
jgi:hypothetical protein